MDETRALLDALMGPNRNSRTEEKKSGGQPEWAHKSCCKFFLVGFCPHDWFSLTKRALVPCQKIHSDWMKENFETHPDADMYRADYEEDFLHYLEKVAQECDATIVRERAKCRPKGAAGKTVSMPPEVKKKCDELETRYAALVVKSERLADTSLSQSKEMMDQALTLKEELDDMKLKYTSEFQGEDVCEVCGVKYPLGGGGADWHDKESHKRGKTHIGYATIRNKIIELKGKRKSWEKHRAATEERRRKERHAEKDEREKERKKEREREKEREKEREREREREEQRQKELEKIREREREKERERERDRERKKKRSRSRSGSSRRDRSGKGDRDKKKEKGRDRRGKSCSKSRSRSRRRKESVPTPPPPDPQGPPPPPPGKGEDSDGDSDSESGVSVQDEDIPDLWARVEGLPAADRDETVEALSSSTKERLEAWLLARVRNKKTATKK